MMLAWLTNWRKQRELREAREQQAVEEMRRLYEAEELDPLAATLYDWLMEDEEDEP